MIKCINQVTARLKAILWYRISCHDMKQENYKNAKRAKKLKNEGHAFLLLYDSKNEQTKFFI